MPNPVYSGSLVGVAFGKVDTSASPAFAPYTVVEVQGISTAVGAIRRAMYVKAGQVVTVSSNIALGGTDGTVSVSAGGWISMNSVTTAAGDWIWVRTSATYGG